MFISPSEEKELRSFFLRPLILPTQNSILAREQSRLLFTEIRGDENYTINLKALSDELLCSLTSQNPSLASLVKRKLHEHRNALAVIVHSLAHISSHPTKFKALAVSLNASDYQPNRPFGCLSYTITHRLVQMLTKPEQGDALCWVQGGAYDRSINQGVRTRLIPNTSLKDKLCGAGLVWATHPHRISFQASKTVVYVKDKDTQLALPIVRPTRDNEQVLSLVNARLRKAHFEVLYPTYKSYEDLWDYHDNRFTLNTGGQLYRQFVGDDQSGGRLFGHWLQNLPKVLRPYLRINGSPVYELDYQAMQLSLAYHAEMVEPPEGDLYSIPGYEKDRDLFKACFTSAIGTDENHKLGSVFSNAISKQTGSYPKEGQVHELAKAFWDYHKPIKKLSNAEAWRPLQFAESEIMLDILSRLEGQGITAIPLHDAVIVPLKYAYQLKRAMRGAVRHMDFGPPVMPAKWTIQAYPQFN